mmetsp:Transcript_8905/g.20375  ORF Transcript_8905/g.20375 Transcript_8905/m.20375 type:complete len:200 (+) Transcript_8905:98-697(+)
MMSNAGMTDTTEDMLPPLGALATRRALATRSRETCNASFISRLRRRKSRAKATASNGAAKRRSQDLEPETRRHVQTCPSSESSGERHVSGPMTMLNNGSSSGDPLTKKAPRVCLLTGPGTCASASAMQAPANGVWSVLELSPSRISTRGCRAGGADPGMASTMRFRRVSLIPGIAGRETGFHSSTLQPSSEPASQQLLQ